LAGVEDTGGGAVGSSAAGCRAAPDRAAITSAKDSLTGFCSCAATGVAGVGVLNCFSIYEAVLSEELTFPSDV
jgi:hypothetical protein